MVYTVLRSIEPTVKNPTVNVRFNYLQGLNERVLFMSTETSDVHPHTGPDIINVYDPHLNKRFIVRGIVYEDQHGGAAVDRKNLQHFVNLMKQAGANPGGHGENLTVDAPRMDDLHDAPADNIFLMNVYEQQYAPDGFSYTIKKFEMMLKPLVDFARVY